QFCEIFPELLPNEFSKGGSNEASVPCKRPGHGDDIAAAADGASGAPLDAKAKAEAKAEAKAKPAESRQPQRRLRALPQAAPNNANGAAAAVPIAGASRKWIILFVLLAYLFASKAVSRLLNA
ncbi:hypothetical protein LPJ75_002429, partial [Coemansia sp. RSA 2598]